MQLILIRHGETDWNREYRAQGQTDMPLNATGRAQAEAIGQKLADQPIATIYTSPLQRTRQTAEAINRYHNCPLLTDGRLKELDLGQMDGVYYPDLKTSAPDFFQSWIDDPGTTCWPGGESLPELQRRVWPVVETIIAGHPSGSVVLASHFFCLLTLFCRVLDLSLSQVRKLNLSVASISMIAGDQGRFKLVSFNDTCHLG